MTDREVEQLLRSLFPGRTFDWLEAEEGDGGIGDLLLALAEEANADGFELVDQLAKEVSPATAEQSLPEREASMGLDASRIALYGSTAQRQAQLLTRWRERGTPTPSRVLAAAVAICGPTAVTLVEHSRADITALNTHGIGVLTAPLGGTATGTLAIGDNAPAARMGAQLIYNVSTGTQGSFQFTLTAPDAQSKAWQAEIIVDGADHVLYWPEFAGGVIDGAWTLQVDNTLGGVVEVQVDRADIFVEGIGRASSGAEGLASLIFEWSLLVDEAAVSTDTYDRAVVIATAAKYNPAHCTGGVALYQTDGGATALADDNNCIADLCVCS